MSYRVNKHSQTNNEWKLKISYGRSSIQVENYDASTKWDHPTRQKQWGDQYMTDESLIIAENLSVNIHRTETNKGWSHKLIKFKIATIDSKLPSSNLDRLKWSQV